MDLRKRGATPELEEGRSTSPAATSSVPLRKKTRMTSTLQTTITLSNVDLDLPDVERPFKVVNTLPLSVDPPVYDETLGENLLSVKDSATLYNSLIISRQNWLYNETMGFFKQYWSRRDETPLRAVDLVKEDSNQDDQNNDKSASKRKNMSKLCECVLQLGPHSFDVRLFIVKDEEVERKFHEEQKNKFRNGIKVKEEEDEVIQTAEPKNDNDNDENKNNGHETKTDNAHIKLDLDNGQETTESVDKNTEGSELNQKLIGASEDDSIAETPKVDDDLNSELGDKKENETLELDLELVSDAEKSKAEDSDPDESKIDAEANSDSDSDSDSDSENEESKMEVDSDKEKSNPEKQSDDQKSKPQEESEDEKQDSEGTDSDSDNEGDKSQASDSEDEQSDDEAKSSNVEASDKPSEGDTKKDPSETGPNNEGDSQKPDSDAANVEKTSKATADEDTESKEDNKFDKKFEDNGEMKSKDEAQTNSETSKSEGEKKQLSPQNEIPQSKPEPKELPTSLQSDRNTPETVRVEKKQEIPQSLENHIMISNLNSLARQNKSLNDLMKTVASGNATTTQIAEFQKYIIEAKRMGDPKGTLEKLYFQQIRLQKQAEREKKLREREERLELKRRMQLAKQQLKEMKRQLKILERERKKQLKQELKVQLKLRKQEEKAKMKSASANDPRLKYGKLKNQKKLKAKAKMGKTKLTALQERYVNDATLSFEFAENAASRHLLPKCCIMEHREQGEIVISFVVVHNSAEIELYEEEVLRVEKLKEEQAKVKQELEAKAEEVPKKQPPRRRRSTRFGPARRSTPKHVEQEPVPEPELVKPVPIYSTLTVKLSQVPAHCVKLILNSANPADEVRAKMEEIFDEGVRQEVDYVWYQLDGVIDEVLAEKLRRNLQTLEAQNVKRAGGGGRKKATD